MNRVDFKALILMIFIVCLSIQSKSQGLQRIKGTITDVDSEMPLIGATVTVVGIDNLGAVSDLDGFYSIENVPTGRQELVASYIGYDEVVIPNVLITSGKETEINIRMKESLVELNEVVITANADKDRPINEMATVSARTFSLEEVTRYSGGRNDVSRLVSNFAGVATSNDSRNDIVVRGNSPAGILWRMEGVPIPNPNHFSTLGTTGGPVSALNTNLLSTSDFLTSAFPAEYGNAISGVFDVGLRSGNKDKFEFTGQLSAFSGLEAMIEGPLDKSHKNSFLVSYRYSFVQLASSLNLDFGTNATPNYQDLSFNVDISNGDFGKFSIFGIGGKSDITFLATDVDENDLFAANDADSRATSYFGVLGVKYSKIFSNDSYIRSILSFSGSGNTFTETRYRDTSLTTFYDFTSVDDDVAKITFHSYYNQKYNSKFTARYGLTFEEQFVNTNVSSRENNPDLDGDGLPDFNVLRNTKGNLGIFQPYATAKYRLNPRFTLVTGLHGQFQFSNTKIAIEPRINLSYNLTSRSDVNLGYGLHSQIQPLPVLFNMDFDNNGNFTTTNKDLDFTKSHHFVLGYNNKLGSNWRLKLESYYQKIYDAPVEKFSSSFSLLNSGSDFIFPDNANLVNEGTGVNYGLEATLEKFFSKGYYGLFTGSIFQSKYKGSDQMERNTAFNNQYVINVLAGKEWALTKKYTLTTDFKFTNAGGRYITPVDLELSQLQGTEVRMEDFAFSEKLDPYLRLDLKIGFRMNGSRYSQQFFIDLQNVTNHSNIFTKRYNRQTNEVNTVLQNGFFPDIMYRIQF